MAALFKNKKVVLIMVILLFMCGIVGLFYYFYASTHVTSDDAFIEGHAIPISPKVSGHVLKVYIDDNQEVRENDPLVEIDERDYEAHYAMAKANLEECQAKAAQALEDVARYKKLILNDEISKQELDHVILRSQVAQAEQDQAKAALEQARLNLSYTKINSPCDGRVTQKSVEEGAFLQVGQTLMEIVSPERWIIVNLKETDLANVRPGQPVDIRIDTYPGKIFKGHVDSIQRGTGARFSLLPPENATGNYVKVVQRVPVKIVFDEKPDPGHPLALGMSVIPTIKTR